MNKPRFASRTDNNHAEIRDLFRECAVRFPRMKLKVKDTSNLGGKVADLIVQFQHFISYPLETHLIEIKSNKKAKFTESQEKNELQLVRIDDRADVFIFLSQKDWELQ